MLHSARLLTVAALLVIGLPTLWLNRLRTAVQLGQPGVKLGLLPVFNDQGEPARSNSVALPTLLRGYRVRVEPITQLELSYLPPDTTYGRRTYALADGSFRSQVSAVLMGTDRTSIHRPEYCLTSQGWNLIQQRSVTIPMTAPQPYDLPVQRLDLRFQATEAGRPVIRGGVYVFWFVADGQLTSSHVQRQLWLMRDLLQHQTLQRWAYISCFSDCEPGQEDATFTRISELLTRLVPEFQLTAATRP
jgi:hypothetical protein